MGIDNLSVSAGLDAVTVAKDNFTEERAAWNAAKVQEEKTLKEERVRVAQAASAVEVIRKALDSEKAALALKQNDIATGDLAKRPNHLSALPYVLELSAHPKIVGYLMNLLTLWPRAKACCSHNPQPARLLFEPPLGTMLSC